MEKTEILNWMLIAKLETILLKNVECYYTESSTKDTMCSAGLNKYQITTPAVDN